MVSPIRLGGEEPGGIEPDVPPPPPSPGAIIKPRNVVIPPTFRGGDFSNGLIDNDDDSVTISVDRIDGHVTISHTEEIVKKVGTYDEDGEELTPPVLEYVVRSATFTPLDIIPSSYAETPSRKVKSGKIVRRKRLLRNENDEIKVRVEKTGQFDWIPEEEFDEALHERIYEEFNVELERTEPSKAVMTTGKKSVTIIAVKNLLKETISLDAYSKRSIRWNVTLDKMVLKKHGEYLQAYKENGKDKLPFKLPAPTASGMAEVHWYWGASTGDLRIAFDTPQEDIEFPLEIDPTFSFDGSDFVIASAQTEIKTYQQLWTILGINGTNVRFNAGFMAADSNGTVVHVDVQKVLSSAFDLSSISDFTIDVKTTNADASWELRIYMSSTGAWNSANRARYTKSLTNDVAATYTLSDFVLDETGTVDDTAINYIAVAFENVDSVKAGNVTVEIKDLKFTAPVKPSDMYNDTGRFVLFDENFEGDDGLDLDEYDSGWTVTHDVGTETVEIDDAQKYTGSTSLGIYRDGVNNPNAFRTIDVQDLATIDFWVRKDATNTRLEFIAGDGGTTEGFFRFNADGNINIFYGNGAGGSNTVNVAYSANIWYHVKLDFDIANSKWRVWISDVLYPGSNADAGGWDNLFVDRTPASINRLTIGSDIGTHWSWVDKLDIYAGFEDFSALTAPHDIDDICEAVSPSGTDYGRGTWDGDWTTAGVSVAVDNTLVVIGTNSIKINDIDNNQGAIYTFDSAVDISNVSALRCYLFGEAALINIRLFIFEGANSAYKTFGICDGNWEYIDLSIDASWSGWTTTGTAPDQTAITKIEINNRAGVADRDLWVDGLHFYGDSEAGLCMKGNSLDVDGNVFVHDNDIYDLKTIKDTSTGGSFISTANIEFSDVALAGYDDNGLAVLTITGTDENNHVLWNAVGDANPTNEWVAQKSIATLATLTYVTFRYATMPIFVNNATLYDVFFDTCKTCPQIQGATNMGKHYKVKVRNNGHASASLYIEQAQVFIEADIDGTKSKNIWMNTGQIAIFINSKFDRDYLEIHVDGTIVSKNHNKTSDYVVATGANGRNISYIPDPYKPDQTFDVDVVAGPFDFDSDLDVVRDLRIRSGVTIDNSSGKLLILGVLINEGTRNDTADDTYCANYELPLPVAEAIAYELNGGWKI